MIKSLFSDFILNFKGTFSIKNPLNWVVGQVIDICISEEPLKGLILVAPLRIILNLGESTTKIFLETFLLTSKFSTVIL